ncbi:MAG: DUF4445 domain-containing protein [candidate division NC10 bacterium]|nr:DUF4445 domain-containing protein [candidate division NC10 bacterium]
MRQYLNIRSAIRIGLIPSLPQDRVSYVGNAAALGAQMALVSETERRRADDLARQIRHISLADHPDFQDVFLEAVTFPRQSDKSHADGTADERRFRPGAPYGEGQRIFDYAGAGSGPVMGKSRVIFPSSGIGMRPFMPMISMP